MTTRMQKVKLHQFDPVLYPFKIWMCVTSEFNKVIKEHFNDYETGKEIEYEDDNKHNAITMSVRQKTSRMYGTLIMFRSKKQMTNGIIAHESSHAAKDLFNHIGANISHHEPFEYLLEWIVNQCYVVKK